MKPNPERERKIKHDLLDNADVIAGTLSGFGGSVLRQYLEGRERQRRGGFDCLIIDEVRVSGSERERKIKHDLLDNADVIAGTLSGFGGSVLRQYLEGRERQRRGGFDCLIIDEVNIHLDMYFYAPNFGKVEGAYCFRLVRLSVHPLQNLLRYSFEISYMDSSSKNK